MTKGNLAHLIDSYGTLKARMADLENEKKALEKSLAELEPGNARGKIPPCHQRRHSQTPDDDLEAQNKDRYRRLRASLTRQIPTAHTISTHVRTHRVSARHGDVAA